MRAISGDLPVGDYKVTRDVIAGPMRIVRLNGNEVASVEVLGDATSKDYSNALGMGAAGAVIAGPLGGIAGAAFSARNQAGSLIKLSFRDGRAVVAAVTSAEHQLILQAIAPREPGKLENLLLWRNATPVTAANGHQMLHGFLWREKARGKPALQIRLWDHIVEWDYIHDEEARRPGTQVARIALEDVRSIEAHVAGGAERGVLVVHAFDRRYEFPGTAYNVTMATRVYEQLILESAEAEEEPAT
ncbi:hypothetical protein ACFVAJ_16310 [Agromyces sp. NPDC057679]|uniref:hypothetical protein n=1 Tax=Agromyces sp. NPDC057679 TaxID=3346207 RepID=UPI00366BBBCC